MKITMCGSTKFKDKWLEMNKTLSLMGHVVYTVAFFGHAEAAPPTDAEKEILDLVHLSKIEESDAVVVLNVDGYVGASTKREVAWARIRGKKVFWLEMNGAGPLISENHWKTLLPTVED